MEHDDGNDNATNASEYHNDNDFHENHQNQRRITADSDATTTTTTKPIVDFPEDFTQQHQEAILSLTSSVGSSLVMDDAHDNIMKEQETKARHRHNQQHHSKRNESLQKSSSRIKSDPATSSSSFQPQKLYEQLYVRSLPYHDESHPRSVSESAPDRETDDDTITRNTPISGDFLLQQQHHQENRIPHESSILVTTIEATLIENVPSTSNTTPIVPLIMPPHNASNTMAMSVITIDQQRLQQIQHLEEQRFAGITTSSSTTTKNTTRKGSIVSSSRRSMWTFFIIILLMISIAIVVMMLLIRNSQNDNHSDSSSSSSNSGNIDSSNTNNEIDHIPYDGNVTVQNFDQMTQHAVVLYMQSECRSRRTDTIQPTNQFYYTIQCGGTTETTDTTWSPRAAIEFGLSSQQGNCIRTQINVLTCHTSFAPIGYATKFGTLFTCGTNSDDYSDNSSRNNNSNATKSVVVPLVTIRTYPVTGTDCPVNPDNNNNNNQTMNYTMMANEDNNDVRSMRNSVITSLNRFCYDIIHDFIDHQPTRCGSNSTMVTFHEDVNDDSKSNAWSFCVSHRDPSSLVEADSNHNNNNNAMITIPSITVIDEYNETILHSSCPYRPKYDPSKTSQNFLQLDQIIGQLSQ
jgi:hypothetical protein